MKVWIASLLCLSSLVAVGTDDKLKSRKDEIVADIDQHIAKLQEHKSCVQNAGDGEAMKACRASMKEFRESERAEHLKNRQERLGKKSEDGKKN